MLEKVSQRFQGSCMMLMHGTGGSVSFLSSCFLVHSDGYLLTTARGVEVHPNFSYAVSIEYARDLLAANGV